MLKRKTIQCSFLFALLAAAAILFIPGVAQADHGMTRQECSRHYPNDAAERQECNEHAEATGGRQSTNQPGSCPSGTVELSVPIDGQRCVPTGDSVEDNVIITYLKWFIAFLAAGFGLYVTLQIAIAGVQYVTAGGNPDSVAKAKSRLTNAIIALLGFIFAFAVLNYLVPGGLIG